MGNVQKKVAQHPSKDPYARSGPAKKVHWDRPGLPSPPGKPTLIPGEKDFQSDIVVINWERSLCNGGSAIIGYHVEHRKMGSSNWVRSAPVLCTFPELTLSGLEPGWRYQFRIRAQNALGLSEPSELSDPLTVTLQRTVSIPPKFDTELKDCIALEGQQAEFSVFYMGIPLPKISWFKDGFEIFSSRRTTITTDSVKSVLVIYKTLIEDEGEIKCSATNRSGYISTRAKLMIEAPPCIRLPREYGNGLLFEQGEIIKLKAINGGRPPPSITWYHNNEIIIVDQRHNFESITNNETILKIKDVNRQDRGEYSIRAINKLGEDVTSFLVTVIDRPGAPQKIQITKIFEKTIALVWNEPIDDGGCKIGTYIIEYYRVGWNKWLKAATSRKTSVILNDLIEGSHYRFRVKAENPYGLSESSEESDTVFIPNSRKEINQLNLRLKSVSHRDILHERFERREIGFSKSIKRIRSLSCEELPYCEVVTDYECNNCLQKFSVSENLFKSMGADHQSSFISNRLNIEKNKFQHQQSNEITVQPRELEIQESQSMEHRVGFTESGYLEEKDLTPPFASISLPDLFSIGYQIIEVIREAVSSNKLLHDQAMNRCYRAVEIENSEKGFEQARMKFQASNSNKHKSLNEKSKKNTNSLFNSSYKSVCSRVLNSGMTSATWLMKRDHRRSSEGQVKIPTIRVPNVFITEPLEIISSDPNLLINSEMLAQNELACDLERSVERLRRWHESGIDLSNEQSIAEMIDKENTMNKEKEELQKLPNLNKV